MKTTLMLVAVVLSGCVGQAAYYCDDPIFDVVEIEDGAAVTCEQIHMATRLARDLAIDSGMMKDFDARARGVIVYVRKDVHWYREDGSGVLGLTHMFPGDGPSWPYVQVGVKMGALLHEMWHVQDAQNLHVGMHENWEYNGRYAVSALYQLELTGSFNRGAEKQDETVLPKPIEVDLRAAGWGDTVDSWRTKQHDMYSK